MSLHQLAHNVQSAGRGDDKVLVHMTPKEVGGLQALAMAHGGSLTINPQTGLPEAGFLKSLLPMVAGLALGPAGLGLSALQAGAVTGLAGAAMTGSLGKGLMMGLGAYGGAGLGAGLSSMGTTAPTAATPALNVATPTASGASLGVEGLKTNLYGPGQGVFSTAPSAASSGIPAYSGSAPFASAQPAVAGSTNVMRNLPTQATVNAPATVPQTSFDKLGAGIKKTFSGGTQGFKDLYAASEAAAPYSGMASLGSTVLDSYYDKQGEGPPKDSPGLIRPYTYERTQNPEAYDIGAPMWAENPGSSRERNYFTEKYTALTPYEAPGPEYRKAANGGLMGMAVGGPVETMAAQNAVGANTGYPMAGINTAMYSNPMVQRPEATNVISPSGDAGVGAYSGEQRFADGGTTTQRATENPGLLKKILPHDQLSGYQYSYNPQTMQFTQTGGPSAGRVTGGMSSSAAAPAMTAKSAYTPPPIPAYQTPEQQLGLESFYPMMEQRLAAIGASQGYAGGGLPNLGDYSDGGRLLKGPGDGVSDSIPAVIGKRQPARLADGEFVVPARIVSEIGNGSTEAGARKLYAMMDRVQKARGKTVGKNKVAANTRSEKYLPA